jgi:GxxExxY protein
LAHVVRSRRVTTKDTKDTKVLTFMGPNEASRAVIDAAMKVHTALGAGMLESTYDACMFYELSEAGLHIQHQVRLPVIYRHIQLSYTYRADFIVENCLIVEIKAVEKLLPVHTAQLLSYLKITRLKLGLLLNFNVAHMRDGILRRINGPESDL